MTFNGETTQFRIEHFLTSLPRTTDKNQPPNPLAWLLKNTKHGVLQRAVKPAR